MRHTGLPAEVRVVGALEARLADVRARPQASSGRRVELLLRDLPDRTEHLRVQRAVRVIVRPNEILRSGVVRLLGDEPDRARAESDQAVLVLGRVAEDDPDDQQHLGLGGGQVLQGAAAPLQFAEVGVDLLQRAGELEQPGARHFL